MTETPQEEKFYLVRKLTDHYQKVEISKTEWTDIVKSRIIIAKLRNCRDLFELLIESYSEIEKFMLISALDYELLDHSLETMELQFNKLHLGLNLRVLTLLTASRCYVEQVPQLLGPIDTDKLKLVFGFKASLSAQFDSSFEYRVMDALRNFAQHAQLPIKGSSYQSSNQVQDGGAPDERPSRRRVTVNPFFDAEILSQSEKIRKLTRVEIAELETKKLDMKWFVRKYVSDLSECHNKLFHTIQSIAESAQNALLEIKSNLTPAPDELVFLIKEIGTKKIEEHYISGPFYEGSNEPWHTARGAYRVYTSSEVVSLSDRNSGPDDLLWKLK